MADLSQEEAIKQIDGLFQKAEEEEHKYKWNYAINLLKQAEKISLDNKIKKVESDINYKLGVIYQIAADFEDTKEKILEFLQLSILHFTNALDVFKEQNNEAKVNASLGFINLLQYISGAEKGKEELFLETAKNYFKKAKEIFLEAGKSSDSLKMKILESKSLSLFISERLIRIDEGVDLKELTLESQRLIQEIWDQIKTQQDFPEIYLYSYLKSIHEFSNWITHFLPAENIDLKQYLINNITRFEEFINIYENSIKTLCLFYAYSFYSWNHASFATYYANYQSEQIKYLKKAQLFLSKGEELLPRIKAHSPLVLFYYTRFTSAIFLRDKGESTREFEYILEDVNLCVKSAALLFPSAMGAHNIFYAAGVFLVGAFNRSSPEIQRINLAKKIQELLEFLKKEIPVMKDPSYKIFHLLYNCELCMVNSILGDLVKEEKEKDEYLQIASEIFSKIADFETTKINNTFFHYQGYLFCVTRAGLLLAKNSSKISEQVNYYERTIELLKESKKMIVALFHIENLFFIGDSYYEIGRLTNDDKILEESSSAAYKDAIEYCKNKGYYNLVGSGYINLARIEDRLGNYLYAAENYQKALDSFDSAIKTLTYDELIKEIVILKNYVKAWNMIEIAKSYHAKEDHENAQVNYEQASVILDQIKEYKFEAPFYSAWAVLQKAEKLSKTNKHLEAATTYLTAQEDFRQVGEFLKTYLENGLSPEERYKISRLIKVAEIRKTYCTARYQLETARLESKKGNHILAAELYNKASSLFEYLCKTFIIKREKNELTAIFYLCKAWQNMERADVEQRSSLYSVASELFEKASDIFSNSKMKKLSLGNSFYCSALENGSLFDKTNNLEEKINYYKQIKMHLRESSKNYHLGGFEQDSQWALATSTFFDGMWHLIQADNEIDHSKKDHFLSIATNYLNTALDMFGKAGYKQKREEILKYIKMVKDEKAILTSALNLIEKPKISESSVGISAPPCPIEISSSVNIKEMKDHDTQAESEINWFDRIHHIYFFVPGGICIYDHSFTTGRNVDSQLVSGSLTGISMLIQELTLNRTKVKIVEQEEMTILLEHGEYMSVALITEEKLITLQNKLKQLVEEVEDFFQEELESFSGNLNVFSKIGKFINKIFEK
ncbi:MAG: tetratricopeptide repeat protein [Promethearchaeota archaeon]